MTTATAASLQCAEALRLLTGHQPTEGMLYFDVWDREFNNFEVEKRNDCPACSLERYEFLTGDAVSWTTVLCGRNAVQITPPLETEVDLQALAKRLEKAGSVSFNGFLLSLKTEKHEIVLFPNGRAIVRGTTDEAEARNHYARYIGT